MEARELPQPQPQAFELVLRIRHPSMDPDAISAELQIPAEHCFKAGEPRKPLSGAERTAGTAAAPTSVHCETYWLATLNPGWWPVDVSLSGRMSEPLTDIGKTVLGRALAACASRFLRPHGAFFHRISSEGGQVRLLVEVNTAVVDGFTLTPELGREMYSLGVPIDFEFSAS